MWPDQYRRIFAQADFRRFWLGFTFSAFGDAVTRVALTWAVYERTRSAEALGWLMVCYTGPVVVGGLLAGVLLDRFDRRRVMFVDNVSRGLAVAVVPLLSALGALELWHLYAVAALYGFLMMISLAGGPALIPELVTRDQLAAANALEMVSYTVAGVAGPLVAGGLITVIGAANVVVLDAVSYFVFAAALASLAPRAVAAGTSPPGQPAPGLPQAVRLLVGHPVLLATTLMFMAANIGGGFLAVWLPVLTDTLLGGGSELYGTLLGAMAVGEVASAVLVGGRSFRWPLGTLICLAQLLAGGVVALAGLGPTPWLTALALALFGACTAPLTVWAQTLRMAIIPDELRGRSFALLRMLMQSGGPLGSAAAGWALPLVGVLPMIAVSAAVIGLPAVAGFQVAALRQAGRAPDAAPEG